MRALRQGLRHQNELRLPHFNAQHEPRTTARMHALLASVFQSRAPEPPRDYSHGERELLREVPSVQMPPLLENVQRSHGVESARVRARRARSQHALSLQSVQ